MTDITWTGDQPLLLGLLPDLGLLVVELAGVVVDHNSGA